MSEQAEQVETPEPQQAASEPTSIEQIDSLLADALGGNVIDENGQPQKKHPEKEPEQEPERELETPDGEDVIDVAEELAEAIPEAVIDYDLDIPMPDGRESMSLGAMKDRVTELERSESQMIERENNLMRQQDEINMLMNQVGELPPELRQQASQKQQQHMAKERDAMLKAIPEWSDRETYDRDRVGIVEVGKQYGFSELEIGQIMDHRVVKFMRDYSRLSKNAKDAERLPAQIKKASKVGSKPRRTTKKSTQDTMVAEAISSGNDDVKQAAISELLRG